jgi:mannose-6-phosphate isomerase-like protein (cupin superfamily)
MVDSFESFRADAQAQGFPEALVRTWPADTVLDLHTHPFDARALVVDGEMWLTFDGRTRHLHAGDWFEVPAGTAHDERYGPQGATYWVARR